MAGDEGLGFLIDIAVDDEGVQPALDKNVRAVDSAAQQINAALERMGNVEVFASLMRGADPAVLKMHEVKAAVEQGMSALVAFGELQHAAQGGSGFNVTKLGGYTQAEIESMVASLRELQTTMRQGESGGAKTGLGQLTTQAREAESEVARLQARLMELREEEQLVAAAGAARIANAEINALTMRSPLAEFQGPGGTNVTAAQQEAASLRAQAAQMAAEKAASAENPNEQRILTTSAASITASLAEERKLAAVEAQGGVYERIAGIQAQLIGLSDKEAQATLAVLAARERIVQANAAGVSDEVRLLQLTNQLIAAETRLAATKEKEAASAAAGGGGFFGGIGRGFTTGFGHGGGNGPTDPFAEAGFQVGMVAQYTLYYQAFRAVEDSIKASINETIEFERHVTDLALQLGTSRDNARELANNLGDIAAAGGLNPSQGVALGQQFAGVFAGEAPSTDLATSGAQLGTQLAVVTGKNAQEQLTDATAAVRAFNLTYEQTARVLDAATTASQHFLGSANPANILPGLAQIGDLAAQAGFSVEMTANALADIQSRTGESSDAAAGELRRFLGREGNNAFQKVFANEGINTTQPFQQELQQLSEKWDQLSQSERNFIIGQFGGGRAGAAATAMIEDYGRVLDGANKSTQEGGEFQRAYGERLNDLRGTINSIRGEFENLAKDFGETGAFSGIGLLLKMLEPAVKALDDFIRVGNELATFGGHATGIRDVAIAVGELYAVWRLMERVNLGSRLANVAARIPLINQIPGVGRTTEAAAEEGAGAEVKVAAAQAAAAVRAAGDELAIALQQVATSVGGGGAEIAAAETAVAEEVLAGGAEMAAAQAAETVLPTLGGRHAGEASAAGLGSLVMTALIGAVAIDAVAHAISGQLKAIDNADSQSISGNTTDELNASASALREAAQAARASSGGIVGTLTNWLSIAFGGEGTGTAANRDQHLSDLAKYQADQLKAATDAAGQSDIASTINLSGNGAITQSLKNLQAQGYDAGQVLDALNQRLTTFATAAAGAGNVLLPGQSKAVAQGIANAATTNLVEGSQIDADGSSNIAQVFAAKKFRRLDPKAVNDVFAQAANDYFASIGVDEGGAISAAQQKELINREIAAMKDHLAKNGFSKKDIEAFSGDILLAASTAVHNQVADANALAGQKLSQDQIGQVLADAPQLVQQAGQEAGTTGSLTGDARGGALTGAQGALSRAQQLYATLSASGADAQKLKPLQDEIDQLTLAAQQAMVAHLDVIGALAASLISPLDKGGQLAAQISTIDQQLQQTTDADARSQLQAKLNQLHFQQGQQALADANAARSAQVASGDAVGKALTAYQNAVATFNETVAEGVTSGQAYSQGLQAMNDARQAAIDAQIAQINAQATANVDPRDEVARAAQANIAAENVLLNTPQFGSDGKQTAQYSQRAQAVNDSYYAWLTSVVDRANAMRKAETRAGDPLAEARTSLASAQASLAVDLAGTKKYWDDLAAVEAAQVALAQAIADRAKNLYLLHNDTTDPVAQANATLLAATRKAAEDRARGVGDPAADHLAVEVAWWARQKAQFDQTMQSQQQAYSLHEESAAQYLRFLESQDHSIRKQLAGMHKGQEGYQQLVDELAAVDQAIQSTSSQLSGQFNLGDIKVPTVYEVRRAEAAHGAMVGNSVTNITTYINGADFQKVVNHLNTILGAQAVSTRSASSGRKVA